ncbi:PRC-barrel domain-containing protein [Kitasatospora mediocidica]|uniref:PRC-barrel domain-containing protein n=1 Tax=Kitasatospora mediocidica TaxID=58352 RepID=UPI00055B075D|nr:PRC-barrel domain-containing protein [Kitasatospora mediocidica]
MSAIEIWEFRSTSGHVAGSDLVGFHVEATDGSIGKVDKHSEEVGAAYFVVDTGPWIFGKHVLLPAGIVIQVDPAAKRVYVDRTRDEIKNGPEFDPKTHDTDTEYKERYGSYYAPFYGGPAI